MSVQLVVIVLICGELATFKEVIVVIVQSVLTPYLAHTAVLLMVVATAVLHLYQLRDLSNSKVLIELEVPVIEHFLQTKLLLLYMFQMLVKEVNLLALIKNARANRPV